MVSISHESQEKNQNETHVDELAKEELPAKQPADEVSVALTDELLADELSGCCRRLVLKCREVGDQMKDPMQEMSLKGKNWIKKAMTLQKIKESLPILTWLPKYR